LDWEDISTAQQQCMKLGKSIRYKNADTQAGSSRFARSSIRVERMSFEIEVYGFKKLVDPTV